MQGPSEGDTAASSEGARHSMWPNRKQLWRNRAFSTSCYMGWLLSDDDSDLSVVVV